MPRAFERVNVRCGRSLGPTERSRSFELLEHVIREGDDSQEARVMGVVIETFVQNTVRARTG